MATINVEKKRSAGRESGADLRVIKTARSKATINQAVIDGYWPLIRKVAPSHAIHATYAVFQNSRTGEITVAADQRFEICESADEWEQVIPFTDYYPYRFESPFAAYLVPRDLAIGERVILEDVIEDHVGRQWQGNAFRVESCEATWNGRDFVIDTDSDEFGSIVIG